MNMPETYSYTRLFRSKFFAPCREILRQAKRPLKVGEIAQRLHQDYPDLQWPGRWSSIYVVLNRACMLPGTHILLVQTTPIRLYQYTGDDTTPDLLEPTIEAPAEELFDSAENKAYAELSAKIKDIISSMNEYAFEELVNRLIVQMGFGKKYKTTPKSGDSGVDGIIYGDELGLNTIYVQAKHYKPENIVGRPAIHQFIGALDGRNGIFVTSSSFSKQAHEAAQKPGIALIDGDRLVELLIRHNIGIIERRTFILHDVDTSYYEELNEMYAPS